MKIENIIKAMQNFAKIAVRSIQAASLAVIVENSNGGTCGSEARIGSSV